MNFHFSDDVSTRRIHSFQPPTSDNFALALQQPCLWTLKLLKYVVRWVFLSDFKCKHCRCYEAKMRSMTSNLKAWILRWGNQSKRLRQGCCRVKRKMCIFKDNINLTCTIVNYDNQSDIHIKTHTSYSSKLLPFRKTTGGQKW